jgi:hypothetical protein
LHGIWLAEWVFFCSFQFDWVILILLARGVQKNRVTEKTDGKLTEKTELR